MKTIWFVVRLAFGALFLYSGLVKLKDPIVFAEVVRNYQLVGDPLAPLLAIFVPWVEVFAGIGLMMERFARGGSFILVASLLIFTGAIGISWARGLDITCGCFGQNETLNYPVKMAQNFALILLGVALWWRAEMASVARERI